MNRLADCTNGAEVFVEALNNLGVDRIFLNPGIDLVPILSTIGAYKIAQRKAPQIVLCTDESVAVAAAHGYAMVSGRPQVVMVFQDVGLLQGGGAMVNLKYGRSPVILCSGVNSAPGLKNWLGETPDQAAIVRNYVKWDHRITAKEDVSSVLHEAFRVASTEPGGPVYLAVENNVFMGKPGTENVKAPVALTPAQSTMTASDLKQASEILMSAQNPLILTAYSGRYPESVTELIRLAETIGARVITTDLRMNFPSTHPLCPGIDAIRGGFYDHYIEESDALLLVDYDFPGPVGKRVAPKTGAQIIHLDRELLKNGAYLWNKAPDVMFEGDTRGLLKSLADTIKGSLTQEQTRRIGERREEIAHEHEAILAQYQEEANKDAQKRPISTDWLCNCINNAIDDDTVIVHMIPSNADALSRQIRRTKPGTIYSWGDSAGSMGWPLGAAFGAKLANPGKLVVSLIGDGGFIYGCPIATLWGATAYNAPFLTISFNNQSYAAFHEIIPNFGKPDLAGKDLGFEVGINIKNPPDFAAVARACNGYGQTVEDPSDLPSALAKAIEEVRAGRPAVLDVKIEA